MEPKFRSSFIPKGEGRGGESRLPKKKQRSIINIITATLFVAMILWSGSVFAYQKILEYDIDKKGVELKEARDALDLGRIEDFRTLNRQLKATNSLITNHIALSKLFSFIESATVRDIQFESLVFSREASGGGRVEAFGKAKNFNAIILQSRVLRETKVLRGASFRNISELEDGDISFSIRATVDNSDIAYTFVLEDFLRNKDI